MPLILMKKGEDRKIVAFSCDGKTRTHLMNLGLIIGENIKVVDVDSEGLIINVKNIRIAVNRSIASKILVS